MTALTSPTVRVRRRKHKVDMGSHGNGEEAMTALEVSLANLDAAG